jgi:hypothetical protein
MTHTTLYNKTEVQRSIKAKDGKTYWIAPRKHTTVPSPVDKLPKGVRLSQRKLTGQPPNR